MKRSGCLKLGLIVLLASFGGVACDSEKATQAQLSSDDLKDTAEADINQEIDAVEPDSFVDEDTSGQQDAGTDVSDTAESEDVSLEDVTEPPLDEGVAPDEGLPLDEGPTMDEGAVPDAQQDTGEIGPCEPPLSMASATISIATFGYTALVPTGGTGNYRFELLTNGSGAILNELSGAYLSGELANTVDVVRITDDGCIGEFELTINVVSDPIVSPKEAVVPLNSCLTFEVSGGSGSFAFEILTAIPVGTIDATGTYEAGKSAGADVVRVSDVETDRFVDVTVFIEDGVGLDAQSDVLALPLGTEYQLDVAGGSETVTLEVDGDAVTVEDGVLKAVTVGAAQVTATDKHIGCVDNTSNGLLSTTLTVNVVQAQAASSDLYGTGSPGHAVGPGDLNGDGFPDAVLGVRDSHMGGSLAGAVFVYSGTATGLDLKPAQVIQGTQRDARFGQRIAVADLDDDGQKDLLVGSYAHDHNGGDRGAVFVYRGIEDGFFESEPWYSLYGIYNSDLQGYDVTTCDFNGDGRLDIATSALRAEDKSLEKAVSDQGAVRIYLGTEEGFSEKPEQAVYGELIGDDDQYFQLAKLELGHVITAADFDGDGLCDLAASTVKMATNGTTLGTSGAVYIYKGHKDTGITSWPVRIYGATNPDNSSTYFGRRLASADLDQDGKAELIVGQDLHHKSNFGAVRIFPGSELGDVATTEIVAADSAPWVVTGNNGNDRIGWDVAVGDVDLDGNLDVLVGSLADEEPGGPGNSGTVAVYFGEKDSLPSTEQPWIVGGDKNGDRFGYTNAVIGDLNGDAAAELLSYATHEDTVGPNIGRVYQVWGAPRPTIKWGSEWMYHDAGVDPGPDWFKTSFDDSKWKSGPAPLGYGDDDEATVLLVEDPVIPTVYFRKSFDLSSVPAWAQLDAVHDDGVAIWINGTLVYSMHMANGFEFEKYGSKKSSENQLSKVTIGQDDVQPFVEGKNVVAVMVKQYSSNSGDLSFDLNLSLHAEKVNLDSDLTPLEIPLKTSYSRIGYSVHVAKDLTGNGYSDLLVGAFGGSAETGSQNVGAVYMYQGEEAGFAAEPLHKWTKLTLKTSDSHMGYALGSGDFNGDKVQDVVFLSNKQDRPKVSDDYVKVGNCNKINDVGALFVLYGGEAPGITKAVPDMVVYGHQSGQRLQRVVSNVDYNGDGKDDLIYSSSYWDAPGAGDAGGVAFVKGRKADASGKVTTVCEPDAVFYGTKKSDRMGLGLSSAGDLNGDGCGDVAVGAYGEDLGKSNQGTVRIIYGWGNKCSKKKPHMVLLNSGTQNATAGYSIAGGHDLDGDGVPDIVTGGPDYRVGSLRPGAAWLIPGAYIKQIPSVEMAEGKQPEGTKSYSFVPENSAFNLQIVGQGALERFGESISLVPGQGATGTALLVGISRADLGGTVDVGGAQLFEFVANAPESGLQTRPYATISGESYRPDGRIGGAVHGGVLGQNSVLIVGGWRATPFGSVDVIDNGAAYAAGLPKTIVDPDAAAGPDAYVVDTGGSNTGPVTFENGVKEIYANYCGDCHTTGNKGGVNFGTKYEDLPITANYCAGKTIGECTIIRIEDGSMSTKKGITVKDADLQTLKDWVAKGMPEK